MIKYPNKIENEIELYNLTSVDFNSKAGLCNVGQCFIRFVAFRKAVV